MNEARAWFVLARARPRLAELQALLEQCGSAAAIVDLPARDLARSGLDTATLEAIRRPDEEAIDKDLAWLAGDDNHTVHWGGRNYPELLARIPDPPTLLYVRGKPDVLHLPALAVVGSRNPTRGGMENAWRFAHHLAGAGFTIVSGLAQGIDAAAHEAALAAEGPTVAVLGHGIDRVYPAANRGLAHRIAEDGALVSEYPLGTAPRREHFPRRNRLISGLGLGTLVVEAARRSGSLITARLAAEQGHEVFAIPGSIHNALSRGCHELIRQGAKLVESGGDIIEELAPLVGHLMQNPPPETVDEQSPPQADGDYEKLLRVLGHDPATTDELAAASGLTIAQVSSMLLILELEGQVEALDGGQYGIRAR